MDMDGSEKERVENDPGAAPEIPLENPVEEEAENEFFCERSDRDREHDDEDALLERFRAGKHLDDLLFARAFAQNPARDAVGRKEERISGEEEDCCRAYDAAETEPGKSA